MAAPKEYKTEMTLSMNDIIDIKASTIEILDSGFKHLNQSALSKALEATAGVLGFWFSAPTPVGVASAVVGLGTSLGSGGRNTLSNLISNGNLGLDRLLVFFRKNPNVTMIKVDVGFISYPDYGVRFATHTSDQYINAIRVKGSSGWQY